MVSVPAIESMPLPGIPGVRVMVVPSLPAQLAGGVRIGLGIEARPGCVLINVPQIARYLISNGVAIEVAAMPRADRAAVELFLDGPARAAAIHERGEVPLLSTAMVSPSGKGVILCGSTGVGKSAVAGALSQRGWLLVAEGVAAISLASGEPVVRPSHNALRLWRDTCELLGIDPSAMRRTRAGFEKYYVPVEAATQPVTLSSVVRFRPDPTIAGQEPEVAGRRILEDYSYKHALAAAAGNAASNDRIATAVLQKCRFSLVDGAHSASLFEMANRVESAVA
jgi:hypothetical protein